MLNEQYLYNKQYNTIFFRSLRDYTHAVNCRSMHVYGSTKCSAELLKNILESTSKNLEELIIPGTVNLEDGDITKLYLMKKCPNMKTAELKNKRMTLTRRR